MYTLFVFAPQAVAGLIADARQVCTDFFNVHKSSLYHRANFVQPSDRFVKF